MIYVYGLAESSTPSRSFDAPGIEDRPVALRTCGDVCAAYSEHAGRKIPVTPDNVWRHEQVIERLMAATTVIPARFGTSFEREGALDAVLERNRRRLRESLVRLAGCVEMGVRVLWQPPGGPEADPTPVASGRDYLLRRALQERRRGEVGQDATRRADEIHGELSRHARDDRRRVLCAHEVLLSGAYLMRREQVQNFTDRVRGTAARHPELKIVGTGPWPPYHFAPTLE